MRILWSLLGLAAVAGICIALWFAATAPPPAGVGGGVRVQISDPPSPSAPSPSPPAPSVSPPDGPDEPDLPPGTGSPEIVVPQPVPPRLDIDDDEGIDDSDGDDDGVDDDEDPNDDDGVNG